ncbi:hypothetical protein SEUCBS139899_004889 [Sporothrix eucalyptigena]
MCDMSHYEKEENLQLTRKLSNYCLARGIASEAEPGRIEGGEDGITSTLAEELECVLTMAEQALEFVATGTELLAPATGNAHGEYGPTGINLDYEHLDMVNHTVGDKMRLVLHGAGPFTLKIFTRCIKAGVTKININKGVNKHYARVQESMRGQPLTKVIEAVTNAMQNTVEEYMQWFGSAGEA